MCQIIQRRQIVGGDTCTVERVAVVRDVGIDAAQRLPQCVQLPGSELLDAETGGEGHARSESLGHVGQGLQAGEAGSPLELTLGLAGVHQHGGARDVDPLGDRGHPWQPGEHV